MLGPPDGVVVGEGLELVLRLGEELLHELLEAGVELGAGAAGVGEEEAPLLDVLAEVLLGLGVEYSGTLCPLKKTMGAWRRSATEAMAGSTTCQVRRFFQSRETTATRLRTSSGSLFQSPRGPWRSLLTRTGARPLARNKSAKLVATTGPLRAPRQKPDSRSWVWTSSSAPRRYQSCWPKKRMPPEPSGAFQSVEEIVLPLLAHREVLADAEVGRDPVDPALEIGVGGPLAAVVDQGALEVLAPETASSR